MDWYLITFAYNGRQMQTMFYSDANTAILFFGFATSVTGTGHLYIYGSGTWQITGPAAGG